MAAVLALLNYVVSVLLSLLGLTQSRADQITVNKILAILTDPVDGLNALHGEVATIIADLASIQGDVLGLGAPQQTGSPVTLPTTPPAGYGAPSSSSNAAAVWSFVSTDEATQMGVIMSALSTWLRFFRDSMALPARFGSYEVINFDPFSLINNPNSGVLQINPATILATHTSISAWLNDVYSGFTWHDNGDGMFWTVGFGTGGNSLLMCTLTPAEFEWFREVAEGIPPIPIVAPVWPGLANVTLGASVALAGTGVTVAGPLDGVIVHLTSEPQPLPYYDFNGKISWGKIGAVAFEDDNGDSEEMQLLGFEDAVYVPKSMRQATFCNIRLKSGTLGTVTPWTRS